MKRELNVAHYEVNCRRRDTKRELQEVHIIRELEEGGVLEGNCNEYM